MEVINYLLDYKNLKIKLTKRKKTCINKDIIKGSNLRLRVYGNVSTMRFHPCRNERVRLLLH